MYAGMVEVVAKSTGRKQSIPEHWLDDPVLGADFELTPTGKAQQQAADGPSTGWTLDQLREHADEHGVDRIGLRSKADLLDAIDQHAANTAPLNADADTQVEGQLDDTGADDDPSNPAGDTTTDSQE